MFLNYFFKLRNQSKAMFRKRWQFTILLVVLVGMATVVIFSAPIFPVETTITLTRKIPLQYTAHDYNISNVPRFVNVTNTDSVGGFFSVRLWMSEGKGVVGGVEFTTKVSTTFSRFIDAGATEKVSISEEWVPLESKYAFFYTVTPPEIQENYNVTETEHKSLISIIGNS
jgi:hypothetical protein